MCAAAAAVVPQLARYVAILKQDYDRGLGFRSHTLAVCLFVCCVKVVE